ncbi:MAG: pyruvate kinase [bacterium]
MRKTKIVCTIGPASASEKVLAQLMDAGMNVARLNFSHGTHEKHRKVIQSIRSIAEKKGLPVAILQDLAGPKIRVGQFENGPIELKAGQSFVLTTTQVPGDEQQVSVTYPKLPQEVKARDRILLADGSIELLVKKTEAKRVTCEVLVGGELSSHKGINLPGSILSVKALTEKDRADLHFGLEQGVDYVAMSFVRRRQDILPIKAIMQQRKTHAPIIAKIEKHEALDNLDEIIEEVDGIMVARGDLAVETALEKVPLVQKMLIKKCNQVGKPVITATQMLKSMVENPRPTRAEANDVANAVIDGTDAVMLSEETAVGQHPVAAVKIMNRIIAVTEKEGPATPARRRRRDDTPASIERAVSRGAYEIALDINASAIITPTDSGSTARLVSTYRPAQPIIAWCHRPQVMRCLNLVWGIYPLLAKQYYNSDEMLEQAKQAALNSGLVKKGQRVVITAGLPVGQPGRTNLIKVDVL